MVNRLELILGTVLVGLSITGAAYKGLVEPKLVEEMKPVSRYCGSVSDQSRRIMTPFGKMSCQEVKSLFYQNL